MTVRTRTLTPPTMSSDLCAALEAVRGAAHLDLELRYSMHAHAYRIIRAETSGWSDIDRRYVRLATVFDHEQLDAIVHGRPFTFGVGRFVSCAFGDAGNKIHLAIDRASRDRAHCCTTALHRPTLDVDEWVWSPLCNRTGGALRMIDDEMYADLAETDGRFGHRTERTNQLTSDEMLSLICPDCAGNAARLYTGECAHGSTYRLCTTCRASRQARIAEACDAALTAVTPLLGTMQAPSIAALRRNPHVTEIRSILQAAVADGVDQGELRSALGWPVATMTALLATRETHTR